MDAQEAMREQKQAQQWAEIDPFTLVAAAKRTLYSEVGQQGGNTSALKPLEEVISRFEHLTRSSFGTAVGSIQSLQSQRS